MFHTRGWRTAASLYGSTEPCRKDEAIDTDDLDDIPVSEWNEEQLARAWRSRVLDELPAIFWEVKAGVEELPGEGLDGDHDDGPGDGFDGDRDEHGGRKPGAEAAE
jgi:hypothetical protein